MAILTLLAFMIGIGIGSLTRSTSPPVVGTAAAAPGASGGPQDGGFQTAASPEALQATAGPLLTAVDAEPRNIDALIRLANFYYDHKQFTEAISFYRRALDVDAKNVDARTDLGTAYWYLGFPDKALAEYEKALAVQPDYPQTLMNMGIVRMEGLKDRPGAIEAWKRLLKANPAFSERKRVEVLIAQAENRQ